MKHFNNIKYAIFLALYFYSFSLDAQVIYTCAGDHSKGYTYSGDGGPATAAGMKYVYSVALDATGNLYIGEANCVIRKVSTAGVITTIAGTGTKGYSGDGGPATLAAISWVFGIAVDGFGNVFFSDTNVVRKISPSGIVTRYAGTGTCGFSGDGGPASSAEMWSPAGLVVDAANNLYIADAVSCRVRMVTPSGIISTVAGSGLPGYSGDGGSALLAKLVSPHGLAVDAIGNLFIADQANHVIRKVSTSGIITTVAGNGYGHGSSFFGGYTGDGGPATDAELNTPEGVAVDSKGNIFISDSYNNRIRKVNTAGIINTYAGTGVAGYSGDTGPATAAQLSSYTETVVVDAAGRVFVADEGNFVVRRIDMQYPPIIAEGGGITTCKNSIINITGQLAIVDSELGQTETWSIVSGPYHGVLAGFPATVISAGGITTPSGLTYTPATGFVGIDSFTVKINDGLYSTYTSQNVNVIYLPDAGTITGPDTLCVGQSLTLSDAIPGGDWSASGLVASVSGGVVSGISTGIDTIFYKTTSICASDSARKIVHVLAEGLCPSFVSTQGTDEFLLKIIPNPSSGSFSLEIPSDAESVILTDMFGRNIETRDKELRNTNSRTVKFNHIPIGNYIVRVKTINKIYREKITVW